MIIFLQMLAEATLKISNAIEKMSGNEKRQTHLLEIIAKQLNYDV